MRRLILFALLASAAWYGWKHYDGLRAPPANEVVIENASGRTLGRLRLSIGDQEYPAYDSLYAGKSVVQKFPLATHDAQFHLHWVLQGKAIEPEWTGGRLTAGPLRTRHRLQIQRGDGVVWTAEAIRTKPK